MGPEGAEVIWWDEENETHLARHRIAVEDVEDVFWGQPLWIPNEKNKAGKWKMIGRNRGGRLLTVVCSWDQDRRILYPITGWDTDPEERAKYKP
jgi:uncharacterized DUF497 family protein